MSDDPRVDAIWQALAPHIEWARGFSLILLFANHPDSVAQIRSRLEASLRANDQSLRVHELGSGDDVRDLTLAILTKPEPDCGALWIPLWWDGSDEARDFLLQRLNERRFLLEREVARPVVLVLPIGYRSKVYVLAPDLWTVRSFSDQLPAVAKAVAEPRLSAHESRERFVSGPPGLAELEWRRLVSASDQIGLDVEDGFRAFHAALDRGSLWDARRIAIEVLEFLVRGVVDRNAKIVDVGELMKDVECVDLRKRRDFSRALDNLGIVEERAGNLAGAGDLFRRSLQVCEELAKADQYSAQAQQDLSVSYENVGGVEDQAGNLETARELYQRALEVREGLAKAEPQSAQTQRDLSVSYNKVGSVEQQAGDLARARELYQRGLEIREGLAKAEPQSAQAQRDLSVSYDRVGGVEEQAGNLAGARELYQRALAVREELAKADPQSAQAQRDLSVSYNKVGGAEEQAGNLAGARELYQRALEVSEALAKADPHSAEAQFDVVLAILRFTLAARKAANLDEYSDWLQRAQVILDDLDTNGQLRGYSGRETIRRFVQVELGRLTKAGEPSASSDPAAR